MLGTGLDATRRWATAEDGSEMSFGDFWDMSNRAKQDQREEYPIADMGGTVLGSVGTGIAGARALEGAAKGGNALAQKLTQTLGGRMAAATGAGALENAATAAGRGDIDGFGELAGTAGLGAIFGSVGQGLGEGLSKAVRFGASRMPEGWGEWAKDLDASRDALRQMTDAGSGPGSLPAILNDSNAMSLDDYRAMAKTLNPDEFLGEASDDMLDITRAFAGAKNTTGKTRALKETAGKRAADLNKGAANVLTDNLDGLLDLPVTPKNNEAFREIFNTPAARNNPVTTKGEIVNGLVGVNLRNGDPLLDPVNKQGPSARIVQTLMDELDDMTDRDGITLQALQNVKLKLADDAARAWSGSADKSYKLSAIEATTLKNYVNDLIKELDPRYAQVAATRAEHEVEQKMIDLGRNMMLGSYRSQPLEELQKQIDTLDPNDLLRVRQGAAQALRDRVKGQPSYLKQFANENPDVMQRVELLLGPHFADNGTSLAEIAQSLDTTATKAGKYAGIEKAAQGQAQNVLGPNQEDLAGMRRAIDIATPLMRIAAGEGTASPIANAARRLADTTPARTQVKILEILAANPEQLPRLLNLLEEAAALPNARLTGGAIGSALGTGLNAGIQK